MPLNESIYRRKEKEEEERRKREQAAEMFTSGAQSSSNSNSGNSSTSSQNSSQTSQGGSQSPSAISKLFHSTARKYSNATANDPTRRNSRGQEVSSRARTRSAVNSPKATGTKIKEDTGEWAKNEAYGALTGFNKELASAADFLLPDVITPKKVQNVLDYYRNADEEQQQKVQASRGDSKLREIAGTIGGETLKNIPAAAMAMLSGGTSVGAQVAGKAVPSLLEGAQMAKTGNIVQRAMSEVARTSGQNPMFWETFMRTVGPTYDNEIQNGADPIRATLSAYANALLNAQIEIGGGVEVYDPSEVFWKAAARSAKEEGLEEVQQYAVENLVNKAVGSNTAKWFSMNRGEDAVINPIDMAEQGFYGAAAGGLMSGGRTLGVNAVNSIRNDNYRNANPDLEERANELIQRASLQGREGEMATRAQNLAEEVSDQMARGKAPTAYQMRELERAVATDEYYNDKAYQESSQERYNQAVNEGRANTVESTGTADEYYGFQRGLTETEQRNYERAKAVMGEDASERSVIAVGRFMTGSESNSDIDTILLDPKAKSAVEELTDVTLPINNTKARTELENLALAHNIANNDRILEETHNDIRTNMSRRGGEFFDQNYDEAVATIDEPNAADIYESFFSRFYTAGTVEGADFEKTYNRIISPLVEDFGEELGTKISQVFNHDFAQKVFAEGQIAMNSVRAKAQGKRLSVKASENPAGFTYEAEARKHISDKEAELFTKLAERAKVHIRLVSSIAGGKANGSYDPETGVILIAADSDNKFITVFKHELTHHLKNTSPEMYQKLEDFVFKRWYDGDPEKMEERVQEYQKRYGFRPDEAREEIIADASEAFFTDQGAINDAVTFNEKMARAIHDGIKSLLDTFLDLVDTDRRADKGYGDFLEDLDILRDAEKMWLEALNESVGRSKAQAETESKAKGEVKHSLKDSDGNTLSKGQQEYFKDSKARDENGNLLVLYHGTENAGFTIFDSEAGISSPAFFFTNNLEIAKGYSGTHDIARMPSFKSVEAVQKAIKNDMDADIEIRKEDGKYVMYEDGDYVDESRNLNDLYNLYNQYSGFGGTSANYKVYLNVNNPLIVDAKGKSWDDITTDFSDEPMTSNAIAEYAKENGYDGVVIRNVVDAGLYNSSGEYKTGTDVIAFNPEQIKDIDNKNPTKDPDIRFSMKTPVEETRKMIAWHNINSSNINGVLELGGLAMPSFAIKPSDIGHGTYGDISIIASKDSIDPKVSKSQMIFGGDAWTPMFPDVSIKASEKVAKRIDERLKGILGIKRSNELPGNLRYPAIDTSNLQDQLQRWGDPYNAYGKNTVLRLAYVMNGLGKQYSLPMKEGNLGGYDKAFWELVDDRLPKKSIQEFINEDVMQYEPILRDIMYETYGKAFDEKFKGKKMKLSNPYKKELSWGEVDRIIYDLNTYRKIGIKPDADTVALENDLDNIIQENEDGYKRWIDELFDGVIEKKGVRNNKDMFTPSGSRRSWESLHDDYNLANIVKAMKGQSKQGNNSMFTTAGNVKGAALKSYSDIEDVRRDLGRIAPEESEEIKSKYDQFMEDTRVLANRIADDPFSGSEMLADILSHAKTEASIYRFLNREYDFLRTQNHLDLKTLATDIYNLGQLANTLPMEYFESKIYRAYPLQEALAIVVPDNLDSKTVDRIKEYNGNILTYKAGNEEDRLAKVNSVEGAKFSLKSNGESRSYQSTITKLENQVKDLKSEFKRTNLKTADQKQVRIQAGKLITRHGSNMQAQKSLIDTFNEIFRLYKEKGTDAFDEVYEIAKNEAVNIVNNISVVHNEGEETYKAIKDYLRNTPITISEDMKRNITDFNDFRKRYFGKLKITNGNTTNIDTVYMELMELFPEQFTEDYVNPADQLYHMADVLDNYAPYYETLDGASEEMQDYVVDIASDIMETAYGLQTKKTFADKKYEEKVRAVEKARQKALESRDVALDRQKKRYEKKLNDLKQHNRDVREGRRERKEESELRSKLLKVARRLDKMKTTKENRTLIQNLIGDMDLVAKSMTGKTLNDLNDLRNWYDEQKEADPFFYDPNVEAKLKRLTKKQIANMDLNDVRDLNEVLRAIETSIRNADKFLKSYYKKSVKKAGLEVIEDVNNSKGVKDNPLGTVDRFFINGTLSPERQIHRITGYNDNDPLYVATKELSKGQRDMLFYQMNSWNMFKKFMKDKQFINSLNGKKAREIELSAISKDKETTIKVTPDVAISLYLSSMNDDNMRHMGVGGVEIPDIKAYKNGELKKAYRNSTRVTFSKEQLAAIEGSLTKQEKAFADTAHEYYNSVAPKAINEVSEILKGYSLAQVENYFPIQVNKNFLDRDFESLKFDGTIEGMGSLKERVKASNPIVINGIVDTITRSINENSMYVGLAIPVRNYSKLLGVKNITYTESDRGGKTETKVEYNGSVNESISKKWGDQAMKYIEKFMTDLQTSRGSDDDWEAVLNKWRSNYAGAVLTLNASVAIKQAASYPTAMAVLGAKPLARAMADVGKVDLDLIEKYTPLQWYRSQGYSTKELGDIRAGRKGSAVDKLTSVPILNWIQAMDVLTTRKLWKASEYYVRQNNRSLKQGSDEYYKAVADIYNRVIEETQPNYTVMQRPGLLRSDKSMVQMLNMFKTQPYQNFNILYDSIGNYKAKAKVYKKDKSSKAQADVKKAYKDMQNAVLSQVLQLAVFAAMTSLWALFRGKDDKWRDEDGKLSIESYMKQLGKDMLSGSAAMIPLGADLYNAISSAITGDYYYGFSSVTDSSISDLFNSLNQTMTLIPSVAEYAKERRPGEPIPDDLKKSSKKLLENTSRFSGIPYSNLRNLWDGVYRWVAIAGHGEYVGEYLSQKATFAKTSVMMDNLFKAYRNDKAQYDELRQMMIDDGIQESSIDYGMKDRMKKNKTEAEQKEYDDSIKTLERSSLWKDADAEDKEGYEKIIEKIAVGIEDGDTESYAKLASSGVSEEQAILYKLALKKVDKPNKNGNLGTYTNDEKEAALRLLMKDFNLTAKQKEALKG